MYEKIGNDCEMFYRYDPDGRLGLVLKCDIADGAKHYYYPVTNSRGDIMEIHNGPGQITAKYNYDAWGKLLSVTDANGNVLPKTHFAYKISVKYRGYEYDSETGLYYLQSRYYDPETGRFINADDAYVIGYSGEDISYNAFAYCDNNPVNMADYTGYDAVLLPIYTAYSIINEILFLLGLVGVAGGVASSGALNHVSQSMRVGVISNPIVIAVLSIRIIILSRNAKTVAKTEKRTLADTKSKVPNNHAFKFAYVDSKGTLQKVGKSMTFVETLTKLGIKKASNSLKQRYDILPKKPEECKSQNWGVYTSDQSNAKALAVVLGCTDPPEAHGTGKYGHYHDKRHELHIWYGDPMYY